MSHHIPTPDDRRFDDDGEWIVRQFIKPGELRLDPEEYVARYSHNWGTFSLHRHQFTDPLLGAWVRRVWELLASPSEVERCRELYLTPEEAALARQRAAEEF